MPKTDWRKEQEKRFSSPYRTLNANLKLKPANLAVLTLNQNQSYIMLVKVCHILVQDMQLEHMV